MKFSKTGLLLVVSSLALLALLVLLKEDFDSLSAFLCSAFHANGLDMSTCPAHNSNASWLFTAAFGFSFLTLAIGGFLAVNPKTQALGAAPPAARPKKEFREVNGDELSPDEKAVYDAVRGKGGSAYQSDLVKETGFSKVKATRVLDKLEFKDLIERKRRGMTNLVVLK
ncbi:MAG TPA: hypothetical protein VJA40_01445 [archaeon]|nr:hypothetical protein [archaeon]